MAALDARRTRRAIAAAAARRARGGRRRRDGDARPKPRALIAAALPRAETNDADYVFLSFVMANLPRGLVGLLLAVILCAAMSSTASELTALGGCTVVDFYRRSFRPDAHRRALPARRQARHRRLGRAGGRCSPASPSLLDNLIQAVNILGSLFYGTILGIFLVAFFAAALRATPVFVAALALRGAGHRRSGWRPNIGFLWFNVIGCAAVLLLSSVLSLRRRRAS